jgi:hypothetical protein
MTNNSYLIDFYHRTLQKHFVNCADFKTIIMKKLLILSLLFLTMWGTTNAQEQKLAPYIKIGQFNEDISTLSSTIELALKTANFDILELIIQRITPI